MKKIFRLFLQGLVYIGPIGITLYIIYFVFTFTDGLLEEYFLRWIGFRIPGLGLLLIILFITLIGWIGQTIIARPVGKLIRGIIGRTPVIRDVYNTLRDLFGALVGKEKKFSNPVLVKVNTVSELEKIGFLTQDDLLNLGIKDKVAVYFPHSYNFSGEMFIVPSEHVRPLDIPAAEAMKFVVSGGMVGIS
ncbi:MAG: DUF502 domain-containing protein [Bacteroidota bacterium]